MSIVQLTINLLPSPPPSSLPQKYDVLLCSAPAADFDCSGLYDSRLLLNAVAHAATQHPGCLRTRLRVCLFVLPSLTPSSAAAASVTSIDMSHNCLTPSVAAELQQHLPRFPALQRVNVSINPFLGRAGVALIASSLPGAWHDGHMRATAPCAACSHCCCRRHQEHQHQRVWR